MGRNLGTVPDEIVDQYDSEAKNLGLNRIEYIRQCIEIGRMVFCNSGRLDIRSIRNIVEDGNVSPTETGLEPTEINIKKLVETSLGSKEDYSPTLEEIHEEVYGSRNEQLERIITVLEQLEEQKIIKSLVDGRIVKTNE